MDQTHLPFVLDNGRTNDAKGSKEFWFSSGKSGLDKRQNTIQLNFLPTELYEGNCIKASEKGSCESKGLFPKKRSDVTSS